MYITLYVTLVLHFFCVTLKSIMLFVEIGKNKHRETENKNKTFKSWQNF